MLEVVLWPFSSTLDNQVLEFNIINYNRFSQVWVKNVCQQEDACVVPHQHQQQVWGTPRQSIWNIKNGRMTWVPKRLLIVIDVTKWFEWLLVVVMGKSLATFWHPLVPGRRFLPHGSVWLVARCSSAFMAGELLGPFFNRRTLAIAWCWIISPAAWFPKQKKHPSMSIKSAKTLGRISHTMHLSQCVALQLPMSKAPFFCWIHRLIHCLWTHQHFVHWQKTSCSWLWTDWWMTCVLAIVGPFLSDYCQ